MIKSILTVVFGILLLLAFIALIVWSVQVSKEKMANKRSRRTTAVKKKYEEALEGDTEADMGYWYNKEDMEDGDAMTWTAEDAWNLILMSGVDVIIECINDLVVEMYDCGLVRTEELYMIAYGIEALTPDSPVFHITGVSSDDDDAPVTSLPPVSTDAQRKIYERWTSYVNALLQLVEIRTSEDNKKAIIDGLMTYGRKNLLTLLYSPE